MDRRRWMTGLVLVCFLGVVLAPEVTLAAEALHKPDAGKKINVFVFGGQSNMEGRADGSLVSSEDRKRLIAVQDRVQLAFNHQPIRPLDVVQPSKGIAESYNLESIFGPELFFGISLAEAWPDEQLLLIKRTQGGSSLHGCWNPDWSKEKALVVGEENEPRLYADLIAYVRDVLSEYDADEYEIRAIFWVQGESDSQSEVAAASYKANLRSLVQHVRHDLGYESLPFLLFQVGRGEVVQGMKDVARELPNVTLVPQSTNPGSQDFYQKIENGHYNHEGQKKLGLQFVTMYLSGQR